MSGRAGHRREPPLRALDLLASLIRHGVELVVIGGYSLAAHGYVRGTKDLDVVPDPSRSNLKRLLAALEDLEAEHLAVGDFGPDEASRRSGAGPARHRRARTRPSSRVLAAEAR